MMHMGLTQKHTVLDEKTLQNVAFVIFLRRKDGVDWHQLRNEADCEQLGFEAGCGYLVFKELVGWGAKIK